MAEAETLVPVSVVSGTPALPTNIFPALPEGQLPVSSIASGNPSVGSPVATINIVLSANNVVSGTPSLPTLIYDIGLSPSLVAGTAGPNKVTLDASINSVELDQAGTNVIGG